MTDEMEPQDDELDKALAKIRGQSASPPSDDIDAALAKIRNGHDYHAEFASGALQKRMAGANARDIANANDEEAATPDYVERAATHVLNAGQGIPGVQAVEAAGGALGSKLTAHPMDYRHSLATLSDATGQIGGKTGVAEKMMGSIAVAPFLPSGVIKGGATLGAADGLLDANPDLTKTQRGLNTLVGAGAGAATGAVLKGAGNIAQRSGLTDALASRIGMVGRDIAQTPLIPAAEKIGNAVQSVGETLGTKGAANRLLNDRQQILDQLSGSEKSAAQTMIDHVDAYKARANDLYDQASQDDAAINSPRVRALADDPIVRKALDWAGRVYESRGGTIPQEVVSEAVPAQPAIPKLLEGRVETPPLVPKPSNDLRSALDAFDRAKGAAANRVEGTPAQQMARTALERHAAESSLPSPVRVMLPVHTVSLPAPRDAIPAQPEITADLPNPEILALAKRSLQNFVEKGIGNPGVSQEEAIAVLPRLNALRNELHDASPAWKDADAFYSHAKNMELAYEKAFNAQQKTTAGGLNPSKLRSPEAIQRWVDQKAGTSIGIARASGQQAGAAGRINEAVRNAPLGTSLSETLDKANGVFQPSETAAKIRRPAFGSSNDALRFVQSVGDLTAKSGKDAGSSAPVGKGIWRAMMKPNALATPEGAALRSELVTRLADPSQRAAVLRDMQLSKDGRSLLQQIQSSALAGINSANPYR